MQPRKDRGRLHPPKAAPVQGLKKGKTVSDQPKPNEKPNEKTIYPRVVYHDDQEPKLVQNEEELHKLGEGWELKPSPAKLSKDQRGAESVAQRLADLEARVDALDQHGKKTAAPAGKDK